MFPVGHGPVAQMPVGVGALELANGGGPGAVGPPPGALGVRVPEDSAGVLGAPGVVGPPCPPGGGPGGVRVLDPPDPPGPGTAGGTWGIVVIGHEVEPSGGGGTFGGGAIGLGPGPGALLGASGCGSGACGGDTGGGGNMGGGTTGGSDTGGAPGGGPWGTLGGPEGGCVGAP